MNVLYPNTTEDHTIESTFSELFGRVKDVLGIKLSARDSLRLKSFSEDRVRACGMSSVSDYLDLLLGDDGQSEWHQLIHKLTIPETYFFRDEGQCRLLQQSLLPQLLKLREKKRTIRVWSAGCSSGEEVYTIGMMLNDLLMGETNWELHLLGTDIDQKRVQSASRGFYRDWSFRNMNVSKRYRFFRSVDNGWQLQDELRNITRFEFHNLVTDPPPTLDGQPFDLIICRNVFIYLTSEAKKSCIKHLLQGLAPDGFLVAGHNELYGFTEGLMGLTMFADGYAYQKKAGGGSKPLKPAWSKASKAVAQSGPITRPTHKRTAAIPKSNTVLSRPAPTKIKPHSNNNTRAVDPASDDKVVKARKLFDSAAYSDLVDFTNRLSAAQPGHYTLLHLRARALANLAKYEEARACAEEMSGLRPFDPLAHFLIAHIHEADDDFYLAQQSLQKVVYLDPQFVPAYLGLALLYARQGDQKRSDQMRETALGVLQNLPDGAVIDPYTGETADEVLKQMGLGIPDDEGHLVRRQ